MTTATDWNKTGSGVATERWMRVSQDGGDTAL
jgi:hypothetical protein